jgi:hypothetical protein
MCVRLPSCTIKSLIHDALLCLQPLSPKVIERNKAIKYLATLILNYDTAITNIQILKNNEA